MRCCIGVRHEGQSCIPCFSWSSLHLVQTTWWAHGKKTTDISSHMHMTHSRSRRTSLWERSWSSASSRNNLSFISFKPSLPLALGSGTTAGPQRDVTRWDDSTDTLRPVISCSNRWISSRWRCLSASAFLRIDSSFLLAAASACSLDLFSLSARKTASSFAFSSCLHLTWNRPMKVLSCSASFTKKFTLSFDWL